MAKVKIEIYPWLTKLLSSKHQAKGGAAVMEQEIAEGDTVNTFLKDFIDREEKLGPHLFDPLSGRLTDQISIVVNNRFIDLLDGPDTRLNDGDTIMLFQAWSGG